MLLIKNKAITSALSRFEDEDGDLKIYEISKAIANAYIAYAEVIEFSPKYWEMQPRPEMYCDKISIAPKVCGVQSMLNLIRQEVDVYLGLDAPNHFKMIAAMDVVLMSVGKARSQKQLARMLHEVKCSPRASMRSLCDKGLMQQHQALFGKYLGGRLFL